MKTPDGSVSNSPQSLSLSVMEAIFYCISLLLLHFYITIETLNYYIVNDNSLFLGSFTVFPVGCGEGTHIKFCFLDLLDILFLVRTLSTLSSMSDLVCTISPE